jgi:hypothetical protein
MHLILANLDYKTSRWVTEAAAALGLIGALLIVGGTLPFLRRPGTILGGLLLAIAFLLLGFAIHFGVNPYRFKVKP